MTPFTAEIDTLVWQNLAVTAFTVNVRLHSRGKSDTEYPLVVTQIQSQSVIFVDYVLHKAVAYILEP